MSSIIRIRGLNKTYASGFQALKSVDLDIRRGEIFALLGPNGAGKTTMISIICGIVTATRGSVTVDGHDIVRDYRHTRSLIGLVPQELSTDAFESVWATCRFSRGLFGKPPNPAHLEKVLRQLSLWDKKDSKIMTLSGGMKRRVLIAKALAHEPAVLFLDEPTAGLDPQSRIAMWEILGELHVDGQTILMTTHYMEEADQLCDRLAIIDHGKVLALDTPEELKRSTGIDTSVLVTADGDLQALADFLHDRIDGATTAKVIDGTVHLGVKGARGVLPQVVQSAEQGGFTVTDLSLSEPTLETVFIDLTGKDLRE